MSEGVGHVYRRYYFIDVLMLRFVAEIFQELLVVSVAPLLSRRCHVAC